MRLVDAAKPTFARHETFHPRYGWFRKAHAFVANDPRIFISEDAPVRIGVGKNMVRAIRFWGLAAKLIEEDLHSSNRRAPNLIPTSFGRRLFGDNGWDRYMEDPGTLWLLHWMLLAPPTLLPVWWLAFNEFHAVEFTENDLDAAIAVHLDAAGEWTIPHWSSVTKDISALLRTYAPAEQSGRTGIDDLLDCPLRELNLIGRSAVTNRYRFALGAKHSMPPEIVAYAALDYIARTGSKGNMITLGRLTHESGAPGKIFKLGEGELVEALEATVQETDAIDLTMSTTAIQLVWSGEPCEIATEILNRYYACSTSDIRPVREGEQRATAASGGAFR